MREDLGQRKRVMGRPRGRERLGEGIVSLQRARLLRSAAGLLAEHGYASASVAAIVLVFRGAPTTRFSRTAKSALWRS